MIVKRKLFISTIIVLFLLSVNGNAQTSYSCPGSTADPENDTLTSITTFLTSDEYDDIRVANNISYLKGYTPTLLTSTSYSCYKLNNFVNKYTENNSLISYNYYKVGNYYFIVSWFEEMGTGFKSIYWFDDQYDPQKVWPI